MGHLKGIATYAFRGTGKFVLITIIVLSIVMELAQFANLLGLLAILFISAYFAAIYFQLVQSSAVGDADAPDFPDTANLIEDLFVPMLHMLMVALVSFGPLVFYTALTPADDLHGGIVIGLLALGIIYYPMGMLAVVVLGSILALNPLIVIPSIFRSGWLYWLGIGMLCVLYIAGSVIESQLGGSLIVGTLVQAAIGGYTFMTNARILGIIYREREEELAWV